MPSLFKFMLQDEEIGMQLYAILGNKEAAQTELHKLVEVSSVYDVKTRQAWMRQYSKGYMRWLMAGLPPLAVDQIRAFGSSKFPIAG